MCPFYLTKPTDEQSQPNSTHGSVHVDPIQPTNAVYDQLKSAVNTMFTYIYSSVTETVTNEVTGIQQ